MRVKDIHTQTDRQTDRQTHTHTHDDYRMPLGLRPPGHNKEEKVVKVMQLQWYP